MVTPKDACRGIGELIVPCAMEDVVADNMLFLTAAFHMNKLAE